ncbi:MAG: hypothetical protein H7Y59_11130 [Anaerolineales bacterium]|nr:hypothetical protein [Anaerolineales bacterium]
MRNLLAAKTYINYYAKTAEEAVFCFWNNQVENYLEGIVRAIEMALNGK